MDLKGNPLGKRQAARRSTPYRSPRLKLYGNVARLTGKPGTRGDGTKGTSGDKGQGG